MLELAGALGLTSISHLASDNLVIVPLMLDGSEGANNTNGIFGDGLILLVNRILGIEGMFI